MASKFQNVTDTDVGAIKSDTGNFNLLFGNLQFTQFSIYASKRLKCMVGKECCTRSNRSLCEDKDSRNIEGHLQ